MKMKKTIFTACFLFASILGFSNHKANLFMDEANDFLQLYVNPKGEVNYKAIKQNPENLNQILSHLEESSVNTGKVDFSKAFYINAYNILVIKGVVDHYPIEQPLDVKGFFDEIKYNVAGENLTLNQIEHEKIRPVFNDPRIHFALVCAAKGCPKLRNAAYTSSKIEKELDEQAKETINNPTFVRVKPDSKLLVVSEIFSWYKSDFTAEKGSVKNYINAYLNETAPASFKIVTYPYDWRLNEQ